MKRPAQPAAAVWWRLLGQEAGQQPSFLLRLRHRRFLFLCGRCPPSSPLPSRQPLPLLNRVRAPPLRESDWATTSSPLPSSLPTVLCASDPPASRGPGPPWPQRVPPSHHTFECTEVAPLLPATAPPGAAPTPAPLARRSSPAWSASCYPAAARLVARDKSPRQKQTERSRHQRSGMSQCGQQSSPGTSLSKVRSPRMRPTMRSNFRYQTHFSPTLICFVHLWSRRIIEICFATLTSLCVRLPLPMTMNERSELVKSFCDAFTSRLSWT